MPGLDFQRLPAMKMLAEQEETEQRQLTSWFDEMRYSLDQQELEPEQHQKQYAQIMRQAQQQGLSIKNKHTANAQFLAHINDLVEDGSLAEHQAKKIAYRMAGIQDQEMLRELSGEPKQVNWTKAYNENVGVQRNIMGFIRNYKVDKGRLFQVDSKGEIVDKNRPEEADVVQHYDMALNLLDYYKQQERDIYGQLTPMGQAALEMERVALSRTGEMGTLRRMWEASKRIAFEPGAMFRPGEIKDIMQKGMLPDESKRSTPKEVLLGPDLPRPTTAAEYNRLMPGTKYLDPSGTQRTKR